MHFCTGVARRIAASLSAAVFVGIVSVSCEKTTAPTPVASLTISPGSSSIVVNTTQQFSAVTLDGTGNVLSGRTIAWTVAPAAVASVSSAGLVTPFSVGSATVTATSEGKSVTAGLTVTSGVSNIVASAPGNTLVIGRTLVVTASAQVAAGISPAITWSSSNTNVATVVAGSTPGTATVTGVSVGAVTITAVAAADLTQQASVALTVISNVALNLTLTSFTLTQVVQRPDNSVSMVAGNTAVFSAYGTATTSLAPGVVPQVRIRIFQNGATIVDDLRAATGTLGFTTSPSTPFHQLLVPGSLVRSGMSVLVELNPAGAGQIPESTQSDNVFPANGSPLAITVKTMLPFPVQFVPIFLSTGGVTGNVNAGIVETKYLATMRKIHPVSSINATFGAPFTISQAIAGGDVTAFWAPALAQLDAKRVADGATAHYFGVVPIPAGTNSVSTGGLAYIGTSGAATGGFTRTAMGVDATFNWSNSLFGQQTLAHELGHNMGRRHAPCGGAGNVDPNFPYAGASIGVVGWDVYSFVNGLSTTLQLKSPATSTDIMSYCYDWISDYTYQAIIDFRSGIPAAAEQRAAPAQTLLVSGTVTGSAVTLSPSYLIETPPVVPDGVGPYAIEGFDVNGRSLFRYAFSPKEIDHNPDESHFTFAIPVSNATRDALVSIRASGGGRRAAMRASASGRSALLDRISAGGLGGGLGPQFTIRRTNAAVRLTWDSTLWQGVLVRDPETNEVLAFGTGGDVTVLTTKNFVRLVMSDGVQSGTQLVPVP